MKADERAHLESLLATLLKRLRALEIQEALKGVDTPPHVRVELDDLRQRIADITEKLRPQTIDIDLFSYEDIGSPDPGRIRLNWVPAFNPTLPTPEIWRTTLLPELR